jgi:hypothetical protein
MSFHFHSFGGGINKGCNVVYIADVVSVIMPEIVLIPPHKLGTQCREANARGQTPEYRNSLSEPQLQLPTRIDCAFVYCKSVQKEHQNT